MRRAHEFGKPGPKAGRARAVARRTATDALRSFADFR
jgi:hypothetical protein